MLQRITDNLSRIVLIVGALVIVAMLLFPPWRYIVVIRERMTEAPAGYAFVTRPPDPEGMPEAYTGRAVSVKMDTDRLMIQIAGAALVAGLIALACRKRNAATH